MLIMIIANVYFAVTHAKHLSSGYLSVTAAFRGRFHFPYKEIKARKAYINFLQPMGSC